MTHMCEFYFAFLFNFDLLFRMSWAINLSMYQQVSIAKVMRNALLYYIDGFISFGYSIHRNFSERIILKLDTEHVDYTTVMDTTSKIE